MKKYIIVIAALVVVLFSRCDEESFDYNLYQATLSDVDSVGFSTGAYSLIANGEAKLNFFVDLYRSVRYEGDSVDSYLLVDLKDLPAGTIKIYDETDTEVGMNYSTTSLGTGMKTFRAEVNGLSSIEHDVILREQPVLPPKLYVNVIFHVFEYNPNSSGYDPVLHKKMDPAVLQDAIDDLNEVFNNELGDGPNAANANIEFRLATAKEYMSWGVPVVEPLEFPGYHMEYYDKGLIPPPPNQWTLQRTYFMVSDFTDHIDANYSTFIWDQKNYFNIYIMPMSGNTGFPAQSPQYQYVENLDNGEGMPGMGEEILQGNSVTYYRNIRKDGLMVSRSHFFRGASTDRIELQGSVGNYYGVRSTLGSSAGPFDDYCTDTRKYDLNAYDNLSRLIKVDYNGNKFKANNITDAIYTPSARNTITADQVTRIRFALENCPGRLHGKTE